MPFLAAMRDGGTLHFGAICLGYGDYLVSKFLARDEAIAGGDGSAQVAAGLRIGVVAAEEGGVGDGSRLGALCDLLIRKVGIHKAA